MLGFWMNFEFMEERLGFDSQIVMVPWETVILQWLYNRKQLDIDLEDFMFEDWGLIWRKW